MKFAIRFSQLGVESLSRLPRHAQAEIMATVKAVLSHLPLVESKSRVKKLTGNFEAPTHRLRVSDYRVFYSVSGEEVVVMMALRKEAAHQYLAEALLNPPSID